MTTREVTVFWVYGELRGFVLLKPLIIRVILLPKLYFFIRKWETCLGTKDKYLGPHVSEVRSTFTNSIVARKTIQPGECLSRDNLCLKKPGTGLPAEQLTLVLKSIAIREIPENTPVRLTDIEVRI